MANLVLEWRSVLYAGRSTVVTYPRTSIPPTGIGLPKVELNFPPWMFWHDKFPAEEECDTQIKFPSSYIVLILEIRS